jgi:hypothetical protein
MDNFELKPYFKFVFFFIINQTRWTKRSSETLFSSTSSHRKCRSFRSFSRASKCKCRINNSSSISSRTIPTKAAQTFHFSPMATLIVSSPKLFYKCLAPTFWYLFSTYHFWFFNWVLLPKVEFSA